MLRSVIQDSIVSETLRQAGLTYPRIHEVFDGLAWVLARKTRDHVAVSGDSLFYLHKQASGGWGIPALLVVYSLTSEAVVVHALRVG